MIGLRVGTVGRIPSIGSASCSAGTRDEKTTTPVFLCHSMHTCIFHFHKIMVRNDNDNKQRNDENGRSQDNIERSFWRTNRTTRNYSIHRSSTLERRGCSFPNTSRPELLIASMHHPLELLTGIISFVSLLIASLLGADRRTCSIVSFERRTSRGKSEQIVENTCRTWPATL